MNKHNIFISAISEANSNPVFIYSNKSAFFQFFLIFLQYLHTNRALFQCRMTHNPDNSPVGYSFYYCQFTKIFIQCYQHPILFKSQVYNYLIASVLQKITYPKRIIPCIGQYFFSATPNTTIKQYFHASLAEKGKSIRSWATILWAYIRHACMSSGSSQSYPCRIISGVSPVASIPNICSTANRLPRMMGLPSKIAGLTVIRSNNFFSSMKIKLTIKILSSTITC